MLGSAKVTIKEIQDALWYYYFDIDQAAVYLLGKFYIFFLSPPLIIDYAAFSLAVECE